MALLLEVEPLAELPPEDEPDDSEDGVEVLVDSELDDPEEVLAADPLLRLSVL